LAVRAKNFGRDWWFVGVGTVDKYPEEKEATQPDDEDRLYLALEISNSRFSGMSLLAAPVLSIGYASLACESPAIVSKAVPVD
jgi:hypothetical protein